MSTDSVFTIAPASLTLGAVLSRGSPGITLYKAELLLGQRTLQVAVKRLCTSGAPPSVEVAFLKEIHVLQLASGTCGRAVRMLGCCKLDGDPCIVMTLYPKSAAKLLEENAGPLHMAKVINLAVEVLEGLVELHAANIWHLDLKPSNILLDQYGHAYLSDFGISYALRTLEACTALTAPAGTPHYMAPEQVDAEFSARGSHSDVWGFGATMLHLATGELPYKDLTMMQMATAMLKTKSPSVPDTLPAWFRHLLKQCFSFDVLNRPPVPQLLQVFTEQLNQRQTMPAAPASSQNAPARSTLAPAQTQQPGQVKGGKPAEVEKQVALKACLNHITSENFHQILAEIIAIGFETEEAEIVLVDQIFNKALTDTAEGGMCADLCFQLNKALPSFEPLSQDTNRRHPSTFRKLLLNKCQEEFENGIAETEQGNPKQQVLKEQYLAEACQRAWGNIQFVGHLYRSKLLTEKIAHECIKTLMTNGAAPQQGDLVCLVKLMSTIGRQLDANPKATMYMSAYFERITMLSKSTRVDSQTCLMLQDLVELRLHSWVAPKQDSH